MGVIILAQTSIYLQYARLRLAKKKIALTFDDGPAAYTREILKILEDNQIKATFFCIGKQIEKHSDTVKRIYEAGHHIGNHSYSHSVSFDFWSTTKVR